MCEFCKEHGEGKKWYLNIKNYADDLISDLDRRKFISRFNEEIIGNGYKRIVKMERIAKEKKLPSFLTKPFVEQSKKVHYGQVIPMEDVEKILHMTTSIVRLACGCRFVSSKKEERCCYGISLQSPWFDLLDMNYFGNPDIAKFETVSPELAMKQIRELDEKRLIHTIWTFGTPFIGGLCNCGLDDCLGLRATFKMQMPLLFRAEYIADIKKSGCTGCKNCVDRCPVKAIEFSTVENIAVVNKEKCYGCGVCRTACPHNAIELLGREKDTIAANIW